ncbi:MAG: SDR family oxidoreductase [Gammaproteobacteria bacterium]|nr:SDR family oxidoreductase [Gammaproteobacteria bacterium]
MNKPVSPVVIIGCGDIGTQVAHRYLKNNNSVAAIVRSEDSKKKLESLGIAAQQNDLSFEFELQTEISACRLFHFAPPPREGTEDTHTRNLITALKKHQTPPSRIVYISTTGVYGDCQGKWINEDAPVNPQVDRAKRRYDAEQQLLEYGKAQGTDIIILRVAGIYGPGKLPLKRISEGHPVVRKEDSPFTNRIHSADLVKMAVAAMQKGRQGAIYHACDGHPGTMAEYFTAVADKAGLPFPAEISLEDAKHKLSAGMMSYMRESRRLRNEKTLAELGITLDYPTLESGLENCGL